MPERKRFFSIDPFPYSVLNLSQPTKSWAISTILEAAPCTTVGAKVLKCLSLCPATIGRMKNNWGNGDKPLCISYLSFHAREAAHPFAFYHFRPNSLTLISSVRSSNSHPDLLVTQQHQHPPPLFQITPVLDNNIELSLSEPLQLYKGYNAI